MNTISIQYCFRKLISEDNKFSKAVLYRKYNKIVTFSSKNDYRRKLIFGMSHIFEDIIFSKKIQLLWNKNAFENMFNKFIIIKKSCYLLHRHDYHVVKVNNMIIIVKKVLFIYFIFTVSNRSIDWVVKTQTAGHRRSLVRFQRLSNRTFRAGRISSGLHHDDTTRIRHGTPLLATGHFTSDGQ